MDEAEKKAAQAKYMRDYRARKRRALLRPTPKPKRKPVKADARVFRIDCPDDAYECVDCSELAIPGMLRCQVCREGHNRRQAERYARGETKMARAVAARRAWIAKHGGTNG